MKVSYLFFSIVFLYSCLLVDAVMQCSTVLDFDQLLDDPNFFDGKCVTIVGIYSGFEEPIVFRNYRDFRSFKYKESVLILSKAGDIPDDEMLRPMHGKPVIARGQFQIVKEEYVRLFIGELKNLLEFRRLSDVEVSVTYKSHFND